MVKRLISMLLCTAILMTCVLIFAMYPLVYVFSNSISATDAVLKRYDELFDQFGYKKENIVMTYGYVRDIEQYMQYEEPMKAWRCADRPSAGVLVQAVPAGDENQVELQFIVSLDD